jgi:hypothetical protein
MVNRGMIGKSKSCSRMVAYVFNTIDYGEEISRPVFGADNGAGNKNQPRELKKMCEVLFHWMKDGVEKRIDGVIKCRKVSGVGPYKFEDMTHSVVNGRGVMCKKHMYPVYHQGAECTGDLEPLDNADRTPPNLLRLVESGVQNNPHKQSNKTRSAKTTEATVIQIKQMLKSKGLSVTGNKCVWLKRLRESEKPVIVDNDKEFDGDEGEGDEGDEGDGGAEGDEGDGPQFILTRVDGCRIVRGQVQHRVYWLAGDPTWESSAQSVICGWPEVRAPYNDENVLQELFDRIAEKNQGIIDTEVARYKQNREKRQQKKRKRK